MAAEADALRLRLAELLSDIKLIRGLVEPDEQGQLPVRCRLVRPPSPPAAAGGRWAWKGVEARRVSDEVGWGVFATEDLAPGLIIPYGGVLVPRAAFERRKTPGLHALEVRLAGCVIDGAPGLPECAGGRCIAALMNEATAGGEELYNCRSYEFVDYEPTEEDDDLVRRRLAWVPDYNAGGPPVVHGGRIMAFVVMCTVRAGQQLLVSYGGAATYGRGGYRAKPESARADAREWAATDRWLNENEDLRSLYGADDAPLDEELRVRARRGQEVERSFRTFFIPTETRLRFVAPPTKLALGAGAGAHVLAWQWDDVRLVEDEVKGGWRVEAAAPIAAGLILPYCGVLVPTPAGDIDSRYVITHSDWEDRPGEPGSVDADPHNQDPRYANCRAMVGLAGMVNEASASQRYNSMFWTPAADNPSLAAAGQPQYPDHPLPIYLVVACDLDEGDELMVHYGGEYERDYDVAINPVEGGTFIKSTSQWRDTLAALEQTTLCATAIEKWGG